MDVASREGDEGLVRDAAGALRERAGPGGRRVPAWARRARFEARPATSNCRPARLLGRTALWRALVRAVPARIRDRLPLPATILFPPVVRCNGLVPCLKVAVIAFVRPVHVCVADAVVYGL